MNTRTIFGLLGCIITTACGTEAGALPARSADIAAGTAVCQGPVTIHRQADVRSVGATCGSIDGDLAIVGTDVTDLDGLGNIRSVRYLVVANNPRLSNIRGLAGLHVARGVTIVENPALRDLTPLDGVVKTSGIAVEHDVAPVTALSSDRALASSRGE